MYFCMFIIHEYLWIYLLNFFTFYVSFNEFCLLFLQSLLDDDDELRILCVGSVFKSWDVISPGMVALFVITHNALLTFNLSIHGVPDLEVNLLFTQFSCMSFPSTRILIRLSLCLWCLMEYICDPDQIPVILTFI